MQITSSFPGLTGSATDAQNVANLVISKTSSKTTSNSTAQSSDLSDTNAGGESQAVKDFLDYMKKPLAQRMEDAWLKAHGLTEADLAKMSSSERDAVEKQMAADIKSQMQQQAQAKASKQTSSAAGLTTLLANSM